jgi:hypothetical protein
MPSLASAYRLYQDTTRKPELVARDNPKVPSFARHKLKHYCQPKPC